MVDVLANDGNPAGTLNRNTVEVQVVQQPANGTTTVNANKTITYTSRSTYRGADSFRHRVCDTGTSGRCAIATVNITSAPVTGATASPSQ
jgi:Bacterial Ig domain